ncbi:hypothetical protein K0U07_05270 [bacterium]|nr:hypothetical protein [bacterium]
MAEEKKSFWKKLFSMFSRLASIFRFSHRKNVTREAVKEKPKDPTVKETPAISPETKMELKKDPKEQQFEGLLDQVAEEAKKQKEPKPPKELLSDQEAKNAAKMLPILMALSMATMGPEEEVKKTNAKVSSKKRKKSAVGFTAREKGKRKFSRVKQRSI